MQDGGLNCQQCKADFVAWCSTCYLSKWKSENQLGQERYDCVTECGYWSDATGPEQDCQDAKEACGAMGVSF